MISAPSECFRTNVLCQVIDSYVFTRSEAPECLGFDWVPYARHMSTRYRCTLCGNLTRFDVVRTTRTSAYYHYTTGGELSIEDETILLDDLESVACRWCGPTGKVEEYDGSVDAS